jgi:microcompartment protein CcmK/EutM
MYLGRVIGSVVATIKISHLVGRRLLMVDRLDLDGEVTGAYDIAVDVVQAGPGDTVLVLDEGNGARQILGLDPGAVRAVIVGIVDEVAPQPDHFRLQRLVPRRGGPAHADGAEGRRRPRSWASCCSPWTRRRRRSGGPGAPGDGGRKVRRPGFRSRRVTARARANTTSGGALARGPDRKRARIRLRPTDSAVTRRLWSTP